MNIITKWLTSKKLRLDYKQDADAKVTRIYVNKHERHWTEEDKHQVNALTQHFTEQGYAVLVED